MRDFKRQKLPGQRFVSWLFITVVFVLQGCSHYAEKNQDIRDQLMTGRPDIALSVFEREVHDNSDRVLTHLHKAMLKRMIGEFAASNKDFEIAKKDIADLYTVSVTQVAGSLVVNDTIRDYAGDRYEQVLLHAYMALNYLNLNQLDDARSEMVQADLKMREWGDVPLQNPFVHYLSGLIFEASAQYDQALIAYRKAMQVYKTTIKKHGIVVPVQLQKDFARMLTRQGLVNELRQLSYEYDTAFNAKAEKDKGYLVALLDNGLGPIKSQHLIMSWSPVINRRVKIALPVYEERAGPVNKARLEIAGQRHNFNRVENVDAMARSALYDALPAISARALARMIVKYQSGKQTEKRAGGVVGSIFKLGNLATEIADTRNWSSLPQEIQLTRVALPAGEYTATVEIMGPGGVIDSMPHTITIEAGKLTFISDHWAARRPKKFNYQQAAKN